MKRKVFVLCLCVILVAITIVFGSLAYFTDTGYSDVQTVMVGEVKIKLLDTGRDIETLVEDDVIMPGDSWEKTLEIVNVGKNAAYVRVSIVMSEAVNRLFAFQLSDRVAYAPNADPTGAMLSAGSTVADPAFVYSTSTETVDGVNYVFHTFTCPQVLPIDGTTLSPIVCMKLRNELDHADFDGVGELHMTFLAHAIQDSYLFADVDEAFMAFENQLVPEQEGF